MVQQQKLNTRNHMNAQVLISYLDTLIYKVFVLPGSTQSLQLRGKASRINSPRQRPLKLETPSSIMKTLQRSIQSSSSFTPSCVIPVQSSQLTHTVKKMFQAVCGRGKPQQFPASSLQTQAILLGHQLLLHRLNLLS